MNLRKIILNQALKRARNLINQVDEELERYRLNAPIEHKVYVEEGRMVAETTILSLPVEAAPIIGDVVHNLRATLDLMAVELAQTTSNVSKNVYFPFSDARTSFDDQVKRKNFDKAGLDAVALLKSLEPFKGGNDALRALHDLDIEDKHIALIPIVHRIETNFSMQAKDGFINIEDVIVSHDPASIKFVFPEASSFAGDDVIETLENLMQLVDSIVEAFTALLAARN